MRALTTATMMVLLALAGCASESDVPAGAPTEPDAPAPLFLPAIELGAAAREPSLAFDADGRAYYSTLPNGLGEGLAFWRSDGDYSEWTPLDMSHPADDLSGGDTDVVTTKDAVYVADLDGLLAAGYAVGKSTDHGDSWTWTKPHGLLPPLDRPWMVEDGDDLVGIAYNGVHGLYYLKSVDDGLTFPIHVPVWVIDADTRQANLGRPDMDERTGKIAIPYYVNRQDDVLDGDGRVTLESVGVAFSEDGLLWSHVSMPRTDALRAGIWSVQNAVWTPDDRLIVAFYEVSPKNGVEAGRSFLVRLTEDLSGFEGPVEITTDHTGIMPWVAVSPNGTVGVAYYGTDGVMAPWDVEGDWTVRAAFVDMDTGDMEHHLVSSEVARKGVLCGGGGACAPAQDSTNSRILLDFLNTAWTPDGRFAVAYSVEDKPGETGAQPLPRFAITA